MEKAIIEALIRFRQSLEEQGIREDKISEVGIILPRQSLMFIKASYLHHGEFREIVSCDPCMPEKPMKIVGFDVYEGSQDDPVVPWSAVRGIINRAMKNIEEYKRKG